VLRTGSRNGKELRRGRARSSAPPYWELYYPPRRAPGSGEGLRL